MDKRTIFHVVICFVSSILLVGILQLIAVGPNQQKNHFVRLFPPHFLGISRVLKLDNSKYYIIGLTTQSVYIGNFSDPQQIAQMDWNLVKYKTYRLHLPTNEIAFGYSLHISIDSPFFYVNNYETGSIFRTKISDPDGLLISVKSPKIPTSLFIPSSVGSFVIRTFDDRLNENVLGKIFPDSPFFRQWPQILEKQGEGIFSTDGMLSHDPLTGRFVFVYFYRNQFTCLDSDLHILYRRQTIDTNTQAKIRVEINSSLKTSTMASPGFRVNRASCMNSYWIFINSNLQADNEEKSIFNEYTVMDVYGVKDGNYHFSFYLPKGTGKITDQALLANTMVFVQDKSLIALSLNMQEIKN